MQQCDALQEVVERLAAGLPAAPQAGFLGVDLDPQQAALVLLPVPWEVTASYGAGTSLGPSAMIQASHQMDFEDPVFGQPYRAGIALPREDASIQALNAASKPAAARVIAALERGEPAPDELALVNAAGAQLNAWVRAASTQHLRQGRSVGLVGGDHSSPFGLMQALAEEGRAFGILHIDAHHDLRAAYEGFVWSHASIFYNVLETLPIVSRLVQVGIRDYAREERRYAEAHAGRVRVHDASTLFRRQARGIAFAETVAWILEGLPQRVYVSFDIDGLDAPYCPSSGTPVPGGLSFSEACYLLEELAASGRQVIGFDLCEVAPAADGSEWDANVGARLLYKLAGCLLRSQGRC
jgi:agmatinase